MNIKTEIAKYMKNVSRNFIVFLFLLLICSGSYAQQMINDLVVFTNDGELFTLIMNGERYNEVPQTNVKVRGLTLEKYEVTILFSNKKLKKHTTTVTFLGNGNECVFALNPHGKHYTMDYLSSKPVYNVNNNSTNNYNNTNNNNSSSYNNSGTYNSNNSNTGTYNNSTYSNSSSTYSNTSTNTSTGTNYNYGTGTNSTYSNTTTNSNSSVYPNSNTTGVNISGNGVNVGMNQNGGVTIGTKEGNVNLNTKTNSGGVTITEFGQTITLNKGAKTGCSNPMNELQFEKIKNSVSTQTSDSTKLIAAKAYLTGNCFKTYQIKELDTLFTGDEAKLDFVKNAYVHTYDLNNYHELKSTFQKDATKEEFHAYVHKMRQ